MAHKYGRQWTTVRAYWKRQQPTTCMSPICVAPERPIDYEHERWYVLRVRTHRGWEHKRTEYPWSLDVGHTDAWIKNPGLIPTIYNTRPEHVRCNRRAGGILSGQRKRAKKAMQLGIPTFVDRNY